MIFFQKSEWSNERPPEQPDEFALILQNAEGAKNRSTSSTSNSNEILEELETFAMPSKTTPPLSFH